MHEHALVPLDVGPVEEQSGRERGLARARRADHEHARAVEVDGRRVHACPARERRELERPPVRAHVHDVGGLLDRPLACRDVGELVAFLGDGEAVGRRGHPVVHRAPRRHRVAGVGKERLEVADDPRITVDVQRVPQQAALERHRAGVDGPVSTPSSRSWAMHAVTSSSGAASSSHADRTSSAISSVVREPSHSENTTVAVGLR